eukprot:Gb_14685 [translate_table: standard]
MGKSEGKKKEKIHNIGLARTLREAGKAHTNLSGTTNANTLKKMEHLQRVAVWAAGEGSIPPLGALLGSRLAATGEVSGIPPRNFPFFTCQRCETILQLGFNCSIRVLKPHHKARHRPRGASKLVNVVIYLCNFCSHKNVKPGTHQDHIKKIMVEAAARARQQESTNKTILKQTKGRDDDSPFSHNLFSTPICETSSSITKKRKRKGWSTLKELTSSNQKAPLPFSNLNALKIPSFNLWADKDSSNAGKKKSGLVSKTRKS